MKEKILEQLRQADYLSGERLAEMFHCSRMAIWKRIEELKKEGYRIEAVRHKGYRLLHEPDSIRPEVWQGRLATEEMGRVVYFYTTVETTQQVAHEKARKGAPHGTVVIAEEQLSGRGRLGRRWFSPPGLSLTLSIILRPQIPLERAHHLTLITAVAVARNLRAHGYPVEIKWPNDLLLQGRKVCGILTELSADMDQIRYAVVGIGVNVYHRSEDFPEDLREKAGSLSLYAPPREGIRAGLLVTFMQQYEELFRQYERQGFSEIRKEWLKFSLPMGMKMQVKTGREEFPARTLDLADDGALIVVDEEGTLHTLYSAELFP